jgi:hypothetical protein
MLARLAYGLVLLAILFLASPAHAAAPAYNGTNITQAINSTASYVNTINQSSYLVFYPNLTAAYRYLNLSENASRTNPTYAYSLLAEARSSARHQQLAIQQYANLSLYLLIAIAIVLAVVLYVFMRPYRPGRK